MKYGSGRRCKFVKKMLEANSKNVTLKIDHHHLTKRTLKIRNLKKPKDETHGLCRGSGKVVFQQLEDPPELILLFTYFQSKHFFFFFGNARRYKTLVQMTYFGVEEIPDGDFMPAFNIKWKSDHILCYYAISNLQICVMVLDFNILTTRNK